MESPINIIMCLAGFILYHLLKVQALKVTIHDYFMTEITGILISSVCAFVAMAFGPDIWSFLGVEVTSNEALMYQAHAFGSGYLSGSTIRSSIEAFGKKAIP